MGVMCIFGKSTPSAIFLCVLLCGSVANDVLIVGTASALIVMRCAVWYYLYNLKNVKSTHARVLL